MFLCSQLRAYSIIFDVVTEYNDDDMECDDSDGRTVKDYKVIEVTLSGSHHYLCTVLILYSTLV